MFVGWSLLKINASKCCKIIIDEKSTVKFLQYYNLLPNDSETPNCKKFDSDTKIVIRKKGWLLMNNGKYQSLKCVKKRCQTFQSLHQDNTFFTYTDLNNKCNSKLSLRQISELAYY